MCLNALGAVAFGAGSLGFGFTADDGLADEDDGDPDGLLLGGLDDAALDRTAGPHPARTVPRIAEAAMTVMLFACRIFPLLEVFGNCRFWLL